MGKAAIYNPYLDTLGGGERYTLAIAKILSEELGMDVDFEWKNINIKEKLASRFGMKLSKRINCIKTIDRGEGYDISFWVSDGSIPTLRAKNNYIHFQVPFMGVSGKSLLNKMKLFRVKKIICNSQFTKKVIDQEYGVNSEVLYPPVDTKIFKPKRKENLICYIGRFSDLVQNKGHEILIEEFKKLIKIKHFEEWELILAGGTEVGALGYLEKLKKMVIGYNIKIVESPSFNEIVDILGRSKFFWSAAGFGVDENKNPEKVEHFGITVIEGMSSGCIPIVHNSGGFKEIIESGKSGFLWQNKKELVSITRDIVLKTNQLRELSKKAVSRSKDFDFEVFKSTAIKIFS